MATYTDARNLLRASRGTVDYPAAVGSAYSALGKQNLAARKAKEDEERWERQFGLQREQFETGKEQWGKEFGEGVREFDTAESRLRDSLNAMIAEQDRRFKLAEKTENRLGDYQDWQKTKYGIEFGAGTPEERVSNFWEPMGYSTEPYSMNKAGQYTFGPAAYAPNSPQTYGSTGANDRRLQQAAYSDPFAGIPLGGWRVRTPGTPVYR